MRKISALFVFITMVMTSTFAFAAKNCPANLIPMYEGVTKNEAMLKADENFLSATNRIAEEKKWTSNQLMERLVAKGWESFHDKQDPITAMKRFNQAWLMYPNNSGVYHGMAIMSLVIKGSNQYPHCPYSLSRAEILFEKALAKEAPKPGVYADFGKLLFLQKRFEKAIDVLLTAVEMDPNIPPAYMHLGGSYAILEKYDDACKWLRKAAEWKNIVPPNVVEEVCQKAKL